MAPGECHERQTQNAVEAVWRARALSGSPACFERPENGTSPRIGNIFLLLSGAIRSLNSMARPLRFVYPGAIYHVMARGDGGKMIFTTENDCSLFLDQRPASTCLGALLCFQ